MTGPNDGTFPLRLVRAVACFAFLPILVLLGTAGLAAAQNNTDDPWLVPDGAKQVKNPVKVTPKGLAAAQHLFELNCATCHGPTGEGNGSVGTVLSRKPADFTDAKMMSEASDGELFWKMSTGRPPMPPWKDLLSETERWELVNYLRTFAKPPGASK